MTRAKETAARQVERKTAGGEDKVRWKPWKEAGGEHKWRTDRTGEGGGGTAGGTAGRVQSVDSLAVLEIDTERAC